MYAFTILLNLYNDILFYLIYFFISVKSPPPTSHVHICIAMCVIFMVCVMNNGGSSCAYFLQHLSFKLAHCSIVFYQAYIAEATSFS